VVEVTAELELGRQRARAILEEYRRLKDRARALRTRLRHPNERIGWGVQQRRREELEAVEAERRALEARYRWLA